MIARASSSMTVQTIAEGYDESVSRRFGKSETIRHDQGSGFLLDISRAFNRTTGQKQRASMACRPQADGTAERMVQTLMQAIEMLSQMWIKRIGPSTRKGWRSPLIRHEIASAETYHYLI